MKARGPISAALAAILAVGVAGGANAAEERREAAKVEISIEATESAVKGKVSSSDQDCKSGVTVRLFFKDGGPFQEVARDGTTFRGKYKINGPSGAVPAGKYFSMVKQKPGCEPAVSRRSGCRAPERRSQVEAEREGFEPSIRPIRRITVFETAAFNRSATSPSVGEG